MVIKRVETYIRRYQLIAPGERVIVALSGGPDSVALLRVLSEIGVEYPFTVMAAHLHHGLRSEADADQRFVAELCASWDIQLFIGSEDVAKRAAQNGQSIEEAGREARYEFLEKVRTQAQAHKIATAHHLQDQAETVLMRMIQGTGLLGLQGITPIRERIIRPFLTVSRGEIISFLDQTGISYCIDSTNADNTYLRNRIRNELLPLLTGNYNPNIVQHLAELAESAREENRFWDSALSVLWRDEQLVLSQNPPVVDAAAIIKMEPALRARFAADLLRSAGAGRIGGDDIRRVLELAEAGQTGKRVPVTGGLWAIKSYRHIEFEWGDAGQPPGYCYPLVVPGSMVISETGCRIETRLARKGDRTDKAADSWTAVFDWDQMRKPLEIRSRRPGDRFWPQGMKGSKKLKDCFIDAKLPRKERDAVPLLAADDEVYWVPGWRQSRNAAASRSTQTFLEVIISP